MVQSQLQQGLFKAYFFAAGKLENMRLGQVSHAVAMAHTIP